MTNNDGNHSADEALKNYRDAATRSREKNRIRAEDIDELIMLLSVYVDHPPKGYIYRINCKPVMTHHTGTAWRLLGHYRRLRYVRRFPSKI